MSIQRGVLGLFFCCLCLVSMAQDIILEYQSDVDAFDPTISIVEGDLYIRPPASVLSSDIIDISNLSNITTVNGKLLVWRNHDLTTLSGLENLTYVQGDLEITSNALLANINSLENVDSVGGHFKLEQAQALTLIDNLNNIESIGGDLYIYNSDALTQITGFNNLNTIGGELRIRNNDDLLEINGFNLLTEIGHDLNISQNDVLKEVKGFPNLTKIVGDLNFSQNELLTDIENFNSLDTILDNLSFYENFALDYVYAFGNLTYIGKDLSIRRNNELQEIPTFPSLLRIDGGINISENDKLIKIDGLDKLEEIGESFVIYENDEFREINDLDNLKKIHKQFNIFENPKLLQIGGVNALDSIGENLLIEFNTELEFISGFNSLLKIGNYLKIENNTSLETISGFQKLKTVSDEFRLRLLPSLVTLSGFQKLEYVGAQFYLNNLDELAAINNFNNLESIGGSMIITTNHKLKEINGLTKLTTVGNNLAFQDLFDVKHIDGLMSLTSIDGTILLLNCHDLEDIDGFQNLSYVGSFISIVQTNKLKNLDGFSKLTSINGSLTLSANVGLTSIEGLSNIEHIQESLILKQNNDLENLDGLENIISIGLDLNVRSNSVLSDCCGIQHLILEPDAVNGDIIISNNETGCDTKFEVTDVYCGMRMQVNTNPACLNADNGSIQVNITAYDTIPFYYDWIKLEDGSTGNGVSHEDFFLIENLSTGTYDLTVTNPRPDEATRKNIIIAESDGRVFEITAISSTNSSNQTNNGSIQLTVAGGNPPYSISWSGPNSGTENNVLIDQFEINGLLAGTYDINISDAESNYVETSIQLLDETVPVFPCEEPLDIVILNDVSGSVDATEYLQSKDFFLNFLNEVNIGLGDDESRASFIEWSGRSSQKVMIEMTGNYTVLNGYTKKTRAFGGGTNPHDALIYGHQYLESVARPDVEKVLVLSTDGTSGQISSSMVALADQYKAEGYHIVTIAFDNAFSHNSTRKILEKIASIPALAPGAPSYAEFDEELAIQIVNLYLCPIDPGSSATVFFNRDGAIDIIDLEGEQNCPYPDFVDVNFTISASRELSIPTNTPVTFYLNDPRQFGATKLMTWPIPCTIPIGTTETYQVTLPIDGPSNIYAVLNDDGVQGAPIQFPITELQEIAYSNNIDDESICVGQDAILQALKYSAATTPACDTIVNYTINVCNISETDAFDVTITDEYPTGFVLIGTVVNTNGCATEKENSFDIPAGCCVSLNLTYDASGAVHSFYNDQDVLLSGPPDQDYYNFEGATSLKEDVLIDGTIDCPSTVIEFTKEVNLTESCDDAFLTYTFTINNEMNIPLQGLVFSDIVPAPSTWAFEPFDIEGLSISSLDIDGNEARFTINEVSANTMARFSLDLSIGKFSTDNQIVNSATLDNVPDPVNGGFKTLTSNTTTTAITASPEVILPDTLVFQLASDTIDLTAIINGAGNLNWTTSGDGYFIDQSNASTEYILGENDKIDLFVALFLSISSDCSESGDQVIVLFQECQIYTNDFVIGNCDDSGTAHEESDDTYEVFFNIGAQFPGFDSLFLCRIGTDTYGPFEYGIDTSLILPADGTNYTMEFFDALYEECLIEEIVQQQSCSDECHLEFTSFLVSECDDNETISDETDDTFSVTFSLMAFNPGMDSTYYLIIGNDTMGIFPYGDEHTISLPADGALNELTFIDYENADCLLFESVSVSSCSDECFLNLDVVWVSECDDNMTPYDNTDDTFFITFIVSAFNPGASSSYQMIVGSDTLGTYEYNSTQDLYLPANGIDQVVTFIDNEKEDCFVSTVFNSVSCSDDCNLTFANFTVSECDDNGTPSDDTDDTFEVSFNITASNPGIDSSYLVLYDADTLGVYSIDTDQVITLQADGLLHLLSFIDTENENCVLLESISVESCSYECVLAFTHFEVSSCHDNDTPADNTDDYFSVDFNLSAVHSGIDSTFYVINGNDTLGSFTYGSDYTLNFAADGTNQDLVFVDSQNEDCILQESITAESCSDQCLMEGFTITISACENNDTQDDNTDDWYTIIIHTDSNSVDGQSYYVINGIDTLGQYLYSEEVTFTMSADGSETNLLFVDAQNENCLISQVIHLEDCSQPCAIMLNQFNISECDDNGTPELESDDQYSISFSVSHQSGSSVGYELTIDDESHGSFEYDSLHTIYSSASGINEVMVFQDLDDEVCSITEVVTLNFCSEEVVVDDIVIPNVFSPNDDGVNDDWTIQMNNGSEIILCQIYDRWGNLIYVSGQSSTPEWNGTFNGKKVSQGVYVYHITYVNAKGESVSKFGDITII